MAPPLPMAARLLLETPDEVALALACAFDSPADLLRLGMACRRYRLKTVADPAAQASGAAREATPELWSLASEAARRRRRRWGSGTMLGTTTGGAETGGWTSRFLSFDSARRRPRCGFCWERSSHGIKYHHPISNRDRHG